MKDINKLSDEEVLDYYYTSAVKEIKEEWLGRDSTKWYKHIMSLPNEEKITYLILILDDQISNGGFNQYFYNGYGQFAPETIIALNIINANSTADIVKNAYYAVNRRHYDEHTFRKKIMFREIAELYEDNEELDKILSELDDEYNEYQDALAKLLVDFLRSL